MYSLPFKEIVFIVGWEFFLLGSECCSIEIDPISIFGWVKSLEQNEESSEDEVQIWAGFLGEFKKNMSFAEVKPAICEVIQAFE